MDEYYFNEATDDTEEKTMKEKTFFGKAFDFVKEHKLEIAAGIGLAYLGYKFGVKTSYKAGLAEGAKQGILKEFEHAQEYMVDHIAPEVGVHYDVVRTVADDGYFMFNSSPIVSMSKDTLKVALKESLSELADVEKAK